MDEAQKPIVMSLVRDHFSKATDSDARLVWDDVKGYGFDDAERAIVEHRREKGAQAYRPDVRRVKSLAASYFRDRQRYRWNDVRAIDYLRRNPPLAEYLAGLPDQEAVEAHYTHAWGMVEGSTELGIGRDAARAYILLGARAAFVGIGLAEAEAERRGRECVGLKPGEHIHRRPLFQEPPAPPPSSWDAMKQLAVAEHVGKPMEAVA